MKPHCRILHASIMSRQHVCLKVKNIFLFLKNGICMIKNSYFNNSYNEAIVLHLERE